MLVEVYSDGSATTSDKPGGYGWVIVVDGQKHSEGSGHMINASNNDAELEAAIQGLTEVTKCFGIVLNNTITLVSDSQLVLGWASGRYAFRQQNKIEKYNILQLLVKAMAVQTRWVEGHTGDEHNERCDQLANEARLGPTKIKLDKRKSKVTKEISLTLKVKVNNEKLYDFTHKALSHANEGLYSIGSNYWTTMFVDKLEELMNNDYKYFSIEKEEFNE